MTTTVDTTGPIVLNDVIIPKRLPKTIPNTPPVAPATDKVDLSDAAKKSVATGKAPLSVTEAPESNQPIVYYAEDFYPAPKLPPITEPVEGAPEASAPIVLYVDGFYPTTASVSVKSPDKPTAPSEPRPVTIDVVYPLNSKFGAKKIPPTPQPVTIDTVAIKKPALDPVAPASPAVSAASTSSAARLSSLSGHFIAPYNTAEYLKLFGA